MNWFALSTIAIAVAALSSIIRRAKRLHIPGNRWNVLAWLACALSAIGVGGFLLAMLLAVGAIHPAGSLEWPAGFVTHAVRTFSGQYIVPLEAVGRLQLYDADLHFVRGWQIEAGGGSFRVTAEEPDVINVFTSRGRHHDRFTADGKLLETSVYDQPFDELPNGISLIVPTPALLWPFSDPRLSWLLAVIGGVLLWVTRKIRERKLHFTPITQPPT